MKNNKKIILTLTILILFGLSLAIGISFYIFVGSWAFLFYTIFAGIIFASVQLDDNLHKYIIRNLISAITFSTFCVFGERLFLILKKTFPVDQYSWVHFKVDLELAIYLAIFFFIATFIGIPVKKFLIKHKE